jgi:hypothetical protein
MHAWTRLIIENRNLSKVAIGLPGIKYALEKFLFIFN